MDKLQIMVTFTIEMLEMIYIYIYHNFLPEKLKKKIECVELSSHTHRRAQTEYDDEEQVIIVENPEDGRQYLYTEITGFCL